MLSRLKGAFYQFLKLQYQSEAGRRRLGRGLRTHPGRVAAYEIVRRARSHAVRRVCVEVIQTLAETPAARAEFCALAERHHRRAPNDPVRFDIYAVALAHSDDTNKAVEVLFCEAAENFLAKNPDESNIAGARVGVGHEKEDYRFVAEASREATFQAPDALQLRLDYLKAAYAAGKLLRTDDATEFVARQYSIISSHPGPATSRELGVTIDHILATCAEALHSRIQLLRMRLNREPKVAVFFLSSTHALGHAVLDPYHFLALYRENFDRIIFMGPGRESYRPASRACLQIVEQFGDYVEITSANAQSQADLLLNLSWMSLGVHSAGPLTVFIDHYWSLLRQVVHRSRDEQDPFRHNDWHFTLPPYYISCGEQLCRRYNIDLTRPLIVMHVRDSGYHGIARQSFRDSAIEGYASAVEHLLDQGYQVVRIGDTSMPKLQTTRDGYIELPFVRGYRHEHDPFLISQARFMIGCQSGPCAFARALGVPILTVNAVLHYSLLPSSMEMGCFKRYFRVVDGTRIELSLAEAVEARIYMLDNSYQHENANVQVENASSEEILAAVKDMDAWVANPATAETEEQRAFRELIEAHTNTLSDETHTLPLPIADYVGMCLPGYRVSPSVELMRRRAAPADISESRATTTAAPTVGVADEVMAKRA